MLTRRAALSLSGRALGALGLLGLGGGCASSRAAPFWFSYGGKPREVLLSIVDAFHASQDEHRIAPVFQGDYFETLAKLRTALHVGMAPALTHVVGESLPYLVEAGVLEAIDDVASELDLVPALTQAGMFGTAQPRVPTRGSTYALPFNRSMPIAYINEEIFEAEGVKIPETWDDLRDVARALTRGEGGAKRFGFASAVDWWFWVALVGQAGGSLFDADGRPQLATDEGAAAVELWRGLVAEGIMRPPPGRDYDAWQVVNGDFAAQRAAMIWTSNGYLRFFDTNATFRWRAAPLPRGVRRAAPTGGTFFVVPKGAREDHRRAARAFLTFVMQPEQSNRFATETGYVPVSRAGIERLERDGYYAARPNDRVALDQLDVATGWPWSTSLLRIQREVIQPALEAAILADRPTGAVLDEAQAQALDDP